MRITEVNVSRMVARLASEEGESPVYCSAPRLSVRPIFPGNYVGNFDAWAGKHV